MKIKFILLSLALAVMSAFAFSPRQAVIGVNVGAHTAFASLQCGTDTTLVPDPNGTGLCVPASSITGTHTVNGLIIRVINILLAITAGLAILFIVIGGFQYITSAGNEEQAGKGKKTVINAIIGLVIVILAYVIVNVIATAATSAK